VFISSTVREVLPVVRIEAHNVAKGVPGEVTRAIHAAFRAQHGLPSEVPRQGAGEGAKRGAGLGK
jgi:hypothetical protein